MVIKRKEFIQIGSLATASLMVPKFLKAFEGQSMVLPGNKDSILLFQLETICIIKQDQNWVL